MGDSAKLVVLQGFGKADVGASQRREDPLEACLKGPIPSHTRSMGDFRAMFIEKMGATRDTYGDRARRSYMK